MGHGWKTPPIFVTLKTAGINGGPKELPVKKHELQRIFLEKETIIAGFMNIGGICFKTDTGRGRGKYL